MSHSNQYSTMNNSDVDLYHYSNSNIHVIINASDCYSKLHIFNLLSDDNVDKSFQKDCACTRRYLL